MGVNIQGKTGWHSIPNSIGRSRLPHPTVHLLVNLLSNSDGFNATYSIITEQTGMSSKTISAALDNLKKLGLVSVTKVAGKNGRFDSNDYDFHPDRLWQLTPELVDERLRGKTPAVEGKAGEDDRFTKESGTAVESKAAPLYNGKTKKEQGEQPGENNHPPLVPPEGESADAPKKKPKRTAHLLPEGWEPDPSVIDQMGRERPDVDLLLEHRKFTDYWRSVPDSRGRKKDWNATWRNWIRNSRPTQSRSGGNSSPSGKKSYMDIFHQMTQRDHTSADDGPGFAPFGDESFHDGQKQGELEW